MALRTPNGLSVLVPCDLFIRVLAVTIGPIHHRPCYRQIAQALVTGVVLAAHALTPSLSATGNCCDNAVVESFFSTLKREARLEACPSVRALRAAIGDDIDGWYNPHRLHSSLQYQSPLQYETQLLLSDRAA